MRSYVYNDLERSDITPIDQICSKEFTEGVLKAGSIISIIENKKLNPINFFLYLLQSKQYQEFFTEITSSNNFREAVLSLLYLYPSIVKSKITKSAIKQLHNGRSN
jgi:hypothetical protein